jgi:2-polyprenyl-3-methyl-5-hydroxy-6-metoxy-1,4-benzoquinol methylase
MSDPACIACGSVKSTPWGVATDAEYRTTDDEFRYLKCETCGVLFISPVPSDRLAEIYPKNYYSFVASKASLVQSIKAKLDARVFRKMLSDVPGSSLSALDVGGGSGSQLDALKAASDGRITRTVIVDLDDHAATLAREKGHEYFCGRIETFESESRFDVAMLLNLIEHVDDPGRVLRKLAGMLNPHGMLLVKTPNWDALDARIFRNANWAGYHCPRHWVLFTKESFSALAKDSGFEVAEFSFTQGAPFWSASLLHWLSKRGLAKITRERPVPYHPLFGVLNAMFAALDFMRMPFARTSQMFFVLRPAAAAAKS